MSVSGPSVSPPSRLARLVGFLGQDPGNLQLIADAAEAALDEGEADQASDLLDRYAALAPLPPALINLKGVAAISQRRFDEAAVAFETLLADGANNAALRFNLAWSRAMLEDHAGTLEMLDEPVIAAFPRAAALKVQALHHLGQVEEALACGLVLAERYPDDVELMAAIATAAIDAEDMDLARQFAVRAGGHPAGLTTLGMLQLGESDIGASLDLFDRALIARPGEPRALLGKGLGLLARGDNASAADLLEQGAAGFKNHLGSWIAAGWARFAQGDIPAARANFETALALDDTFAESHGALAVLDVLDGQIDSAKRQADVALRLDRQCLSAALAKSLILASQGQEQAAERIRAIALNQPVGPGGETIAQAMVRLGMAQKPTGGRD